MRKSVLLRIIIAALLIGYPKLPLSNIPIGAILIIAFPMFFKQIYLNRRMLNILMPSFMFLGYCLLRLSLSDKASSLDLSFVAAIGYKLAIAPAIAETIAFLYLNSPISLYVYLGVQSVLICISLWSFQFFNFLLLFQGKATINVFSNIFEQRGLGFGLIHNEGGAFIIVIWCLLQTLGFASFLGGLLSGLKYFPALISIALSRTNAVVFGLYAIISRDFKALTLLAAGFIFLIAVTNSDFPLFSQVLEAYTSYETTGIASTRSTDALITMSQIKLEPESIAFGEGLFLNSDGTFFKDVDIGFLRLMLFGGCTGVTLFTLSNLYPLIYLFFELKPRTSLKLKPQYYGKKNIIFNEKSFLAFSYIAIPLLFALFNVKGLIVVSWAAIAACRITSLVSMSESHVVLE